MTEEKEEKKAGEGGKKKSAPTGKYKELIKQIESLNLVELSELVKELEERFRVPGMPAVSPAFGTGAGAASEATPGSVSSAGAAGGKTKFEVVLSSVGGNKIAVIKAAREVKPDLGLKEAKDLVEAAPKTLLSDVSKEDAEKAKEKLEAAGASVELK